MNENAISFTFRITITFIICTYDHRILGEYCKIKLHIERYILKDSYSIISNIE